MKMAYAGYSGYTAGGETSFVDRNKETANKKGVNDKSYEQTEEIDAETFFGNKDEDDDRLYCEICCCSMTGTKTYESHLAGARHRKNVKNNELGMPIRQFKADLPRLKMKNGKRVNWSPKCEPMLQACSKPLIGLHYVTEWCHRNKLVESRYYCAVCKANCDARNLIIHMSGVKHRVSYMKLFYPAMAHKVKEEGRKLEQAPLAEYCSRQIEAHEGRQMPRVKVEGFPDCDGDPDDKQLEEFIVSNKYNYYNYLVKEGIPVGSDWYKVDLDDKDYERAVNRARSAASFRNTDFLGNDKYGPTGSSEQPSHRRSFDSEQPSHRRSFDSEQPSHRGSFSESNSLNATRPYSSAGAGNYEQSGYQQRRHGDDRGTDATRHSFASRYFAYSNERASGPLRDYMGSSSHLRQDARSSARPYPMYGRHQSGDH